MPSIRDVAREAGISVSTVSIVLRGEAKARNISQATQERVWAAARRLDYQPRAQARPARSPAEDTIILALYWAMDIRGSVFLHTLRGFRAAAAQAGRRIHLAVYPYEPGALRECMETPVHSDMDIICNTTEADIRFLEEGAMERPTVLYNRRSESIPSVLADERLIGAMAARTFASRGHRRAVIVTGELPVADIIGRQTGFVDEAMQGGISVRRLARPQTLQGGYEAGQALCRMDMQADCIFCVSDVMSVGMLRAFQDAGRRVPEDCEIIAVGLGDSDLLMYTGVSLSVIYMPIDKMTATCLSLAMSVMEGRISAPCEILVPVHYIQRESCGPQLSLPDGVNGRSPFGAP